MDEFEDVVNEDFGPQDDPMTKKFSPEQQQAYALVRSLSPIQAYTVLGFLSTYAAEVLIEAVKILDSLGTI